MAAIVLLWTTNAPKYTEKWHCATGAELLSIEPWNTGTDGEADCEDMPQKSIDIRPTDDPILQKKTKCVLFLPSGEDGFG